MIKSKKVSVIINCYNGEKYLNEAIESVLNQTYKNFELILWDNQSNDASEKIFKNYKDERLKYVRAKHHTNLYEARNLAIGISDGEFIGFIDADDMWLSSKLEMQIDLMEKNTADISYGNYYVLKNNRIFRKFIKKLPNGKISNNMINHYMVGILTVLFRSKILKESIFDYKYHMIGDFDLIMRLSEKYKFIAIQEPIAIYRIHENNESLQKKDLYIKEMELWRDLNKSRFKSLDSINELINFEYFKKHLMSNQRIISVTYLFKLKKFKNIIKALLALIVPIKFLKSKY